MALTVAKTNDIAAFQASFLRAVEAAVAATVSKIKQDARDRVPVQSGDLRDSITSETRGLQGEVVAASDHALWVEVGTSKQAAQPFMTPAVVENADYLGAKVAEGLQ